MSARKVWRVLPAYGPLDVPCGRCSAPTGQKCRVAVRRRVGRRDPRTGRLSVRTVTAVLPELLGDVHEVRRAAARRMTARAARRRAGTALSRGA